MALCSAQQGTNKQTKNSRQTVPWAKGKDPGPHRSDVPWAVCACASHVQKRQSNKHQHIQAQAWSGALSAGTAASNRCCQHAHCAHAQHAVTSHHLDLSSPANTPQGTQPLSRCKPAGTVSIHRAQRLAVLSRQKARPTIRFHHQTCPALSSPSQGPRLNSDRRPSTPWPPSPQSLAHQPGCAKLLPTCQLAQLSFTP